MIQPRLSVCVVGSGVSGIVAAHLIAQHHDVTILEADARVGGHTNTVTIQDGPDAGMAVDTGFIVCNDKTYPTFHRFLRALGVGWRWSDMSFGYHCDRTGLCYAGTNLSGLFAQRANAIRPGYWWFLSEIGRFCRDVSCALDRGELGDVTLGEYLRARRHSVRFVRDYITPMAAAIWSTSPGRVLAFPADTLARFFRNHGLLSLENRPRWQTVVGGSHSYLRAFLSQFPGTVRLSTPVAGIRRDTEGVSIRTRAGETLRFDRVVIATHADQALRILDDPSSDERRLLGAWRYSLNETVLHTDASILPPNRRAWASWNYRRSADRESHVTLTYHMNRLQGLRSRHQYCVTLNDTDRIDSRKIVALFKYTHPLFTKESRATQPELAKLNGVRNTWFCGSYFGYGFHEDAVKAGAAVGTAMGGRL